MDNPDIHQLAPEHLPAFLASADGSDSLFTLVAIFTFVVILGGGTVYFTLHSLPERMAHTANSTQFQLISILAILALFTHNNIFWVVALLLAAFRMPDFITPLKSISQTLQDIRDQGRKDDPKPEVSTDA